ncbi:tyrosine-type recombinase/integrase [Rhizobium tumorigenes]|uniref:tyrosine-type recombinase/integrase n=1 Tax=Rhizobium tumorigenes TaxID=2041385 RepID=UPI00241FEE9F|nr:site-specific integrase [Rhizobium tumorigenes]WFS01627.1 site-specific integrase [Rhizobium tumorigenes]
MTIGDVLMVYLDEKAPKTARPKETESMISRLNEFFGEMTVSEIRGKLCREFADDRGNEGGARRDLEVLRAAVNYYHGEHTLDMVPKITLPEKGTPRQRWLTRQEIARLIRAARNEKQCDHLVRLILIGLYTGTRLSATLNLQWMPNIDGGHVDIEKGVIYRKADGERVAHNKRKTPVKVPPRLMRFLRYWRAADTKTDEQGREVRLRYAVHFRGEKIVKPHKAFRTIRAAAGFSDDVTPHVLRHTRATWLAQAGIDAHEAAASLGLTVEEFERTYSHTSPDFQQAAANAF